MASASLTNALGTSVQMTNGFTFDANGNQTIFTDALGHSTTNVLDVLNRAVQVLYPDGAKMLTGFDAASRRVAETNQDGVITLFGFDGAGRLTAVTNALGTTNQVITRYAYDEAANQTAQIDALGRTNQFDSDVLGRKTQHTTPGGQSESWGFDAVGNMIRYTNLNAVVITNEFDLVNRSTNRTSVDGYHVSFAYNPTGQRTNMTGMSGSTSYALDILDRLTNKVVSFTDGPTISLNYRYDVSGSVTNIWSDSSGGVNLQYGLDSLNRITNVLANGSTAASYGFDLNGNLQSVRKGVKPEWPLDSA